MPEAWSPTDDDLVVLLAGVGEALDAPPATALPERVRARIQADRRPDSRSLRHATRRPAAWLRPVAVGLAVAILAATAVAATPSAREAVADWLGIGAVGIEYGDGPPAPIVTRLELGAPVGLDEVSEAAGFPVLRPRALGDPSAVYVRRVGDQREVNLVWPPGDHLPRTAETGVGLLLTQLRAGVELSYLKKLLVEGTQLRAVDVAGARGYWISGAPHSLVHLAPGGTTVDVPTRLAGDVLLWERGGTTYRIESGLGQAEALRIAASLR